MGDNKRYYWLKLKEDFFEDDAINWIEEQPNGKEYCLFYLKLCLKALKTEGMLIRHVGEMLIPYDAKKLGEVTNTDVDTVVVAIELLKRAGLVNVKDDGALYMSQLNTMVGSETKWAEKKRVQRSKKDNVPLLSAQCPTEKEKEKELDKDKDKDKEIDTDKEIDKDKKKDKPSPKKPKKFIPPTIEEVQAYISEKGLSVSADTFFNYYDVGDWHDGNGKQVKNWKQKLLTWNNKGYNSKDIPKQNIPSHLLMQGNDQQARMFNELVAKNPNYAEYDADF